MSNQTKWSHFWATLWRLAVCWSAILVSSFRCNWPRLLTDA